ncbi:MAG: HRDC domain-containing protein, partial [Myxococcales bacterium]|nr:HRDC domain-containing protein [Myxococcales bacterium]
MDCAGWELNYSRAGRDGLDSDCIVFYSWPDVLAYDRMGDLAADENVLAMRREQARDLFGLLQSPGCRHRALVAHFGERLDRCETSCDSCLASDFLGGLPVAGRIRAVRRVAGSPNPRSPRPRATVELDGSEEALFLELKALRKRLAAEQHVPPYVVFSDAVLVAIARERPEDDDALLTISGVGPKKLAKYGSLFLECVRNAHPWRGATARRRTPGSDSVHPALRSDREPGELAELLAFFRVPFAARILRSLEPVVDRNRDGIGVGSVQTGWRRTQAGLRLALGLGVASGLGACIGTIGDGGQNGAGGPSSGTNPPYQSATTEFKCDSDLIPDEVPLKRLSKAQLTNTVGDLVRFALPGAAAAQDSTLGVLQPLLALIPDEHRDGPFGEWGGFKSVDQVVNQEHVDRGYAVAVALGSELAKPERLSLAAGDCATDGDGGNDSACLDAFIRRFGERVLRREVLDADVAFYRAPAGTPPYDQADWADVIALLAAAPHALYFVEHAGGDDSTTAPVQALDAYELASRLSYHFWQSAPDDELFALARSGELLDETVYAEQVERVFASPKTRSAVRTFYSEWFQRDDVAQMNSRVGTPAFDTLRGEFLPSTELRGAMFDEVADMATYYSL